MPHLWAYFVLNQILPVSFSQALFYTALELSEPETQQTLPNRSGGAFLKLLCGTVYLSLLFVSPATFETQALLMATLVLRLVLLAPFFIDVAIPETPVDLLSRKIVQILRPVLVASHGAGCLLVRLTTKDDPIERMCDTNFALTTLVLDMSIGMISLMLF